MIPKVRRWRVRYYFENGWRDQYVDAPTKQFAKWAARDQMMLDMGGADYARLWRNTTQISVWRLPHKNWPL